MESKKIALIDEANLCSPESFVWGRHIIYEPGHAQMYLIPYAKNKGADQPAHSRSLVSTSVVQCLDSMICILVLSKVLRF